MNCPFQYRPNTSDSELKYIPFIIYPPTPDLIDSSMSQGFCDLTRMRLSFQIHLD
jgi:hypothetical protein